MSAVGSILTNQGALDALNSISNTSNTNNTLEQELSSGLSINSPQDNPAGYITAQGFTSQANGLSQATSNANEANSLLSVADGALQQQISVIQSLNSIAVQAANGTNDPSEAESLQNVVTQLASQITTISSQTEFNNISLLDGTFQNTQFQVGANEGQTLSLSIENTSANTLGLNQSQALTTGIYVGAASASGAQKTAGGVLSAYTKPASAGASATGGAFTAGTIEYTGANGVTGSVKITATESAYDIATDVNNAAGTSVSASATNSATLTATAGTKGYNFKIAGSGGSSDSVTIQGATLAAVVDQINGTTNITGISASTTASANASGGTLVLTQADGKNIILSSASASGGSLVAAGSAQKTAGSFKTGGSAIIQGTVHFQSSAAFGLSGGSAIGLANASTLTSLAQINVTTTAGANEAINVVKFALQGLNNQAGQIGAVQQRLEATINNLNTTSQNVTTALGVVQDANIPQVSNQLTEAQIQAQAGVAALKDSTTLQQSYLSLLG